MDLSGYDEFCFFFIIKSSLIDFSGWSVEDFITPSLETGPYHPVKSLKEIFKM